MREPMPVPRVGMRIENDGRAQLQYEQVLKLCRLLTAGISDSTTDLDCICTVAAAGAWIKARKGMNDD